MGRRDFLRRIVVLPTLALLPVEPVVDHLVHASVSARQTVSWSKNIKWAGGNTPIPSGKGYDLFLFFKSGDNWYGSIMAQGIE